MARAARDPYGSSATVTSVCDHMYCWRAIVGTRLYSIDVQRAVTTQLGSGWRATSVGAHLYDWRAVNLSTLNGAILPVLIVPIDRILSITNVRDAAARFDSVLENLRSWYLLRANETFGVLQPVIVPTSLNASQWTAISKYTTCPGDATHPPVDPNLCGNPPSGLANPSNDARWALIDRSIADFEAQLGTAPAALRVASSIDLGTAGYDTWWGAASRTPYAAGTPRESSLTCPAASNGGSSCGRAGYSIGHELGHTFGLEHSCDDYDPDPANCSQSIMQAKDPWDAILLGFEVSTVKQTSFFS
jgi:hypothetical protein